MASIALLQDASRLRESKLWVDDQREPPDDSWEWAKSAREAETLLSVGDVKTLSLDFDLDHLGGEHNPEAANGADVAAWAKRNRLLPSKVTIHSANPQGIQQIKSALGSVPVAIEPCEDESAAPADQEKDAKPTGTPTDEQATPVHLLDTVAHELQHAQRHVARFADPAVQSDAQALAFNHAHAMKRVEGATEHAAKLAKHMAGHDVSSDAFAGEAPNLTSISGLLALREGTYGTGPHTVYYQDPQTLRDAADLYAVTQENDPTGSPNLANNLARSFLIALQRGSLLSNKQIGKLLALMKEYGPQIDAYRADRQPSRDVLNVPDEGTARLVK